MKTRFYIIILFVAILIAKLDLDKTTDTPLFLDNVEALAANEYDYTYYCFGFGSVDCPPTGKKVKEFTTGYRITKYD